MVSEYPEMATLRAWQQQVFALHQALTMAPPPSYETCQSPLSAVQTRYTTHVIPAMPRLLTGQPQGQSLWTEIQRLMRLLPTQMLFWQAARSADKQDRARQAIAQTVHTLHHLIATLTTQPPPTEPP